jgi:hypothetical protein
MYDNVIEKHNKITRITSAKNNDVRIRKAPSKNDLKERIFSYEGYIGGIDMEDNNALSAASPTN